MSTGYTIRLTPAELRSRADDIERNSGIVSREVSEIDNLLNSLKPTFIGQTSQAFFKEFGNAKKDMDQWDDIVKSFAIELRNAADALEKADRSHR